MAASRAISSEAEAREALARAEPLHAPVLLNEVVAALEPSRGGTYLDGTFGAGGYARAMLDAGVDRVIGVDRDPEAVARGLEWASLYGGRLEIVSGRFGELDELAHSVGAVRLQGVVLDIGVSSMQIDEAERGFSFQKDGPLDMRMERSGPSAADIVNRADERPLADILFHYGEERASRRIAKAVLAARADAPIRTTGRLAEVIAAVMPRQRPGQPHPATRSFQALRIAVNDELGELIHALSAAERALSPGGVLAVVTFHSLEDRIVKRFFQLRSGGGPRPSRHAPEAASETPAFELLFRKAVAPSVEEIEGNARARSAKLRAARRTGAPAGAVDPTRLGAPRLALEGAERSIRGMA